jgi:hypothetical protein
VCVCQDDVSVFKVFSAVLSYRYSALARFLLLPESYKEDRFVRKEANTRPLTSSWHSTGARWNLGHSHVILSHLITCSKLNYPMKETAQELQNSGNKIILFMIQDFYISARTFEVIKLLTWLGYFLCEDLKQTFTDVLRFAIQLCFHRSDIQTFHMLQPVVIYCSQTLPAKKLGVCLHSKE